MEQKNPITTKKLILVKQLYQQAVVHSNSQHNMVSRILSIICFDLAVETILKVIVYSLDETKDPADSFHPLMQQCDNLFEKHEYEELPDRANIKHVHSIRNDAQHKAKYPNEFDVNDCRTYVKDFLEKIMNNVWDISFEKLSVVDYVQHKRVKDLLVEAETAFSQGDYKLSVEKASSGLTCALHYVDIAMVGRKSILNHAFLTQGSFGLDTDEDTSRSFKRMQETLLYISLGMNLNDIMHFRKIAGDATILALGQIQHYNVKQDINVNDAEFVVMYSIDTVVEIERIVGNLKAPFGKEDWY